jgi:undecaprenyl phosphate N,N'-diacetylbacillosamine 1-phosphate transferase
MSEKFITMFYRAYIKRVADFLIALIVVLIISPFLLLTTLLLMIANNGKPFFIQTRPGKNGCHFKVIKFKTMNDKCDPSGELLADADRLTRLGKIIRKTSVDELPQLLNVIKGDMSLIGPRPLLVEYLPLYSKEQARRHEVKPGITGWAQVNGRNAISWEKKFSFDLFYVDNLCFTLDIKILWMTIINVLKGKGISQEGKATSEKFNGNFVS